MATKRVKRGLIPAVAIQEKILVVRSQRVILDEDLAELYGTSTKALNQQVSRNENRFPEDFTFHLNQQEFADLRSQFVTANWAKRRYPPRAFTEHGALQVASVLRTAIAAEASILVVRVFVRLREMLAANREFARKLATLERKLVEHDSQFEVVFRAIRGLMEPVPSPKKSPIGFK